MKITIGSLDFDNASYDKVGDVLYLHIGDPRVAAESEQTPEGHIVRYGDDGSVIGVTLVNARWLIDRDGGVTVTLPEIQRIEAKELAPALVS
jgi:uncharacterized protein YuzE